MTYGDANMIFNSEKGIKKRITARIEGISYGSEGSWKNTNKDEFNYSFEVQGKRVERDRSGKKK